MEFLKDVFGDKALTYSELDAELKDNKDIKLANLAKGEYVSKDKLDTKIKELETANNTIRDLQETVKKFDGVDVEKLKSDVAAWEKKYNSDISNIKRDSAVDMAILQAKGKNPKAIKALLDMDKIKLKDDGTLEGLDLEGLKKSDGYLFDLETTTGEGTGAPGGSSGAGGNDDLFISAAMTAAGIKR